MLLEKLLMAATSEGGGAYSPSAVKFDGSNDYLSVANLTGESDSKSGIFSCWVRFDGRDGVAQVISQDGASSNRFRVSRLASGVFQILGINAANTVNVLILPTAKTYLASAKWYHVLVSWDLATTTTHLYINDVSDKGTVTASNEAISYTSTTGNWGVGNTGDGSSKLYGALSELYFAPGQYLDFSIEANRRKFIDASGMPVSLGANGSTPTSTAPAIYLKGDYTGFGTNSGTGGNFTVNGALEKASTTPVTAAVNAVDFDGSADYLSKSGDLTGISDSKSGILSCWVRLDGLDGTEQRIFGQNGSGGEFLSFKRTSGNLFLLQAYSSTPIKVLDMQTVQTYSASTKWIHVLASWDLASAATHIYVNDVSDKSVTTAINATIDYTVATPVWNVGAYQTGGLKLNGAISELYFAPGQYLDFSIEANREKFILAGAPVSLGSDGSTPTGTAPAIYLPNRAALVGTNAGSGGNFTINGAPKDANSTPLYYYAEPVKFDGTNDYLTRGADLTGIADGKAGTVSFWVRVDGGDAAAQWILHSASSYFGVFRTSGNVFRIIGSNSAAATILTIDSSVTYTTSAVWVHVLISFDLAAGVGKIYVNNADVTAGGATLTNDTIDYARASPNWGIGAQATGSAKLNGAIADLWFNTTYLDLSNSANRAKFIDQTTLRPVPLGAKGELPTGSQPLLYLGRDFSNFQTNLGSGGNFTVTGALERATTSPSDVRV